MRDALIIPEPVVIVAIGFTLTAMLFWLHALRKHIPNNSKKFYFIFAAYLGTRLLIYLGIWIVGRNGFSWLIRLSDTFYIVLIGIVKLRVLLKINYGKHKLRISSFFDYWWRRILCALSGWASD